MPCSTVSTQAVHDVTGREDLTDALRKQLLLSRAADLGCNKVAMGDSATRVAVRVVSGTVKGQGFALPGDIQSADARCAGFQFRDCPDVSDAGNRIYSKRTHHSSQTSVVASGDQEKSLSSW